MKINIIYDNEQGQRPGYTNLSVVPHQDEDVKQCLPNNLTAFVEDSEATEIIASHVLQYLPHTVMPQALIHWISKLAKGGQLIIEFNEIMNIIQHFEQGSLDIDTFNRVVFGAQDKPFLQTRCATTLPHIVNLLRDNGMDIQKIRCESIPTRIEATKK